jgi:hypothetical protein
MNILTDAPPETVEINTTEYRLNTDFRACLKIIMAFEDNELTPQEKQLILLGNLYSVVPNDLEAALDCANWFLNGGKDSATNTDEENPRVYSFAKDGNFIYAAFRQTHGIDLATANLHWWTFLALFMDLGQDTTFCQLTALRKRLKTGKASKEERAAAREMGDMIDLPDIDNRTLDEKELESEFLRKVRELEEKRNGL